MEASGAGQAEAATEDRCSHSRLRNHTARARAHTALRGGAFQKPSGAQQTQVRPTGRVIGLNALPKTQGRLSVKRKWAHKPFPETRLVSQGMAVRGDGQVTSCLDAGENQQLPWDERNEKKTPFMMEEARWLDGLQHHFLLFARRQLLGLCWRNTQRTTGTMLMVVLSQHLAGDMFAHSRVGLWSRLHQCPQQEAASHSNQTPSGTAGPTPWHCTSQRDTSEEAVRNSVSLCTNCPDGQERKRPGEGVLG